MKTDALRGENRAQSPWRWIPSLYFAQGLPYVAVMTISVIMYKRLGISNAEIAFYTSWLYLPWVIKPLWSPIVEVFSRRRAWIIAMQLLIGAFLASVALSLQADNFFKISLIFFWLMAFNSATHDIAADGFYILALDSHKQAWFVGVRSTFYRISMIVGQGILVMLAGFIESSTGPKPLTFEIFAEADMSRSEEITIFKAPDLPEVSASSEFSLLSLSDAKIATPIKKIPKEDFARILKEVKEFNGTKENVVLMQKSQNKSLWSLRVKEPIEKFLEEKFSADKNKVLENKNFTGNCAVAFIGATAPPSDGGKSVMNIDFSRGDKSIRLIEGSRREFDSRNWRRPQAVLFQLDPNLKMDSSAVFIARAGNIRFAWSIVFVALSILFTFFFIYHIFALPVPELDKSGALRSPLELILGFIRPFLNFFKKENIIPAVAFILLFRLGESQLVKLSSPFLIDSIEKGGVGLSTGELGFAYGTVGVFLLTLGGIIGGMLAAKHGLKRWIWIMALAINAPDLVYVYMAYFQPENLAVVAALVGLEQLGYGFGFAGYMLFMVYYAGNSENKTSHYAIMTGLMALGMMIPGMWSGWLQQIIGYGNFFIWVCICTLPGFLAIFFLKIDPKFGMKKANIKP